MEYSDRIQLPRLKIIHIMIIAGVLAVVFSVLNSRLTESVMGLLGLLALAYLGLRPNRAKAVLANLPDDPDEKIVALEAGLARCNPYDVGTISMARYRLMELYKVRKRYEEAIDQGCQTPSFRPSVRADNQRRTYRSSSDLTFDNGCAP